jgi:hypothetical protein
MQIYKFLLDLNDLYTAEKFLYLIIKRNLDILIFELSIIKSQSYNTERFVLLYNSSIVFETNHDTCFIQLFRILATTNNEKERKRGVQTHRHNHKTTDVTRSHMHTRASQSIH